MSKRTDLQTLLESTLGSGNVYFQPPDTITMAYPCIVYKRSATDTKFANDNKYANKTLYTVTLIDKSPESLVIDKLLSLPYCRYKQFYTSDNLNHDIFDLYF